MTAAKPEWMREVERFPQLGCRIGVLSGFCGCGDPESAYEHLRDVLRAFKAPFETRLDSVEKLLKAEHPGMYWAYLYWLDHAGLTEHGGSVRGSWLTDKGEYLLDLLEKDAHIEPE
jgi:hypothetical protein